MNHSFNHLTQCATSRQWKTVGIKQHHGIVVPLFSIHSNVSNGIGEYPDLLLLIDWCASIHLDTIQLLPINDTGYETSPYGALSAFALNPLYIGLSHLPHIEDYPLLQNKQKELTTAPQSPKIDYLAVRTQKMTFLKEYYLQVGQKLLEGRAYQEFATEASFWLKDYALFRYLKENNNLDHWEKWPDLERSHSIDATEIEKKPDFLWYCFLQFLCDEQMKTVKNYATQKNILLLGDIPILIDRDSADVWAHRHLFNLNYSAGAPPDMFSEEGQNWGFPIYEWEAVKNENYRWWKERLQWASRYSHLYRIDHIVGFFRIWSIPQGGSGIHGHFIPENNEIWISHGKEIILMMIEACDMLPIGEDLGVIPDGVRPLLCDLGVCGTKVMRWERKWHENGQYIPLNEYPPESMTTVSTHDSETVQQWWEKYPLESQRYAEFKGWEYEPILSLQHQKEILRDSHQTTSLFHVNPLQEYLTLCPGLSWDDPNEERINIPGLVLETNWCYRFKISLEELNANSSLKEVITEMIQQ